MALTKAEPEHQITLKEGIITALDYTVKICSKASLINPIFGTVATVAKTLLGILDDRKEVKAIQDLKDEFDKLNNALDELSEQSHATLRDIKKEVVDIQFNKVVENLNSQLRSFREMTEAQPEHFEQKKEDFINSYKQNKSDQNLHSLYDNVRGENKVFSEPILEFYMEHSGRKRDVMEQLCTYIKNLFFTGLLTFMSYTALTRGDVETKKELWNQRMQHVADKIQETLSSCN